MRLEIIETWEDLTPLQSVWDDLLARSATHSPFQAWDYLQLWWKRVPADYQLIVGIVRDEKDQVRGIAPLAIGADRDPLRQGLHHLGFLNGLGPLQGERLDFIVAKGDEDLITPLLTQVFQKSQHLWHVIRLNKVPADSPNYPHILRALQEIQPEAGVLNQSECRVVKLAENWDAFEKSMQGHVRRNIRRTWNGLQDSHETKVQHLSDPTEASHHFFRLHAMHWPAGVSTFLQSGCRQLHEELIRIWLPSGRVLFPAIVIEGEVAASVYALCFQGEMLIYQMGWDCRYSSFGLGNLAVRSAVNLAIEKGLEIADFLPGDYRYKREWSTHSRYVTDLECVHPLRLRPQVFDLLRKLKRGWNKKSSEAKKATPSSSAP